MVDNFPITTTKISPHVSLHLFKTSHSVYFILSLLEDSSKSMSQDKGNWTIHRPHHDKLRKLGYLFLNANNHEKRLLFHILETLIRPDLRFAVFFAEVRSSSPAKANLLLQRAHLKHSLLRRNAPILYGDLIQNSTYWGTNYSWDKIIFYTPMSDWKIEINTLHHN